MNRFPVGGYAGFFNVPHTAEQLETGIISQAENDEFWERMSRYATIIN